VEGEGEMAAVITNYFQNLFTSHAGNRSQELLSHVTPRVMEEMNDCLLKDFFEAEVRSALDGIGDLKAPVLMACQLYFIRSIGMWSVHMWLKKC
jgi:hypothetical protein